MWRACKEASANVVYATEVEKMINQTGTNENETDAEPGASVSSIDAASSQTTEKDKKTNNP